ncbi:MAG: hypothetical protein IJW49_02730 [Clostridia bacterium]|nr:hypothetical protein [Clostridia bacterium]
MSDHIKQPEERVEQQVPTGSDEKHTDTERELSDLERYELLQAQSKALKKKMLKAACVILSALVLIFVAVLVLNYINRPTVGIPDDFYQFSAPYQGNIMENAAYLEKDRLVYYCPNSSGEGIRHAVTEENRTEFDAGVLFVCEWLDTIIQGDANAYNQCFSEQYWKENEAEGNLKKTSFNPQMLYNIKLTYYSVAGENGEKLVTYKLEYMILQNDGTFRRDIGSGVSREQRVTVRVRDDGSAVIEKLVTVYELRENIVISVTDMLIVIGSVLVLTVVVILVKKKLDRKKTFTRGQDESDKSENQPTVD